MVKVRLQGTTCEIKRMKRCIERNKRIKVIGQRKGMTITCHNNFRREKTHDQFRRKCKE